MADPHWLQIAKTLRPGAKRKIRCCGSDASLIVSDNSKGYGAFCFRCNFKDFAPHGTFSIQQLRERRQALNAIAAGKDFSLPRDFTTDIPDSAALWFLRAGVRHDIASHYGIGYSPFLRRVIVPLYERGEYVGYIARSLDEKPRYLSKMDPQSVGLFRSDPSLRLPTAPSTGDGIRPALVIVEDVLSAIRVGRLVQLACALLGTSASVEKISQALELKPDHENNSAAIWMDGDTAGAAARRTLSRRLDLIGIPVQTIRTHRDPKAYSNREIRSILFDRQGITTDNASSVGLLQAQGHHTEDASG
ncbi:toprim domain-containing protein [Pannonibacter sp. SL95]|uniref:toprim domain-containing protein n=1 Tax=Pannonibacter sp. SL95 TaxID=2995153 RepID=UPI002276B450|nr:toprim domain-containing protein [Pannonibacter sp. SL95]MCY1708378.1 hypothetical protein [Pannonibacter sp. SL95]